MEISFAIQHDPRRAEMLPALLSALPAGADVVTDPIPHDPVGNPWRTYRAALEATPAGATHRIVLQDDVELCADFAEAASRAVAARPDRLIAFCVCGLPKRSAMRVIRACDVGHSWARLDLGLFVPAIANCWPVELIEPALAFVDAQGWPPHFRSDDEIIGRIAKALRLEVLATAPSLVEHPDVVPSLIGKKARGGLNPARVAACFIGDCDALSIDWEPGPR